MSEQPNKKKVVEWSFSFDKVGETINDQLRKMSASEEVKEANYTVTADGVISSTVKLDLSVGTTTVAQVQNAANLFEGDLKYTGEVLFEVHGEAEKRLRLSQMRVGGDVIVGPLKDAVNKIVRHDDLYWNVRLSPNVPLTLDIHGGVGSSRIDLTGMKLTRLDMDGGVGETRLNLPATENRYTVDIDGGVGGLDITIADSAVLNLDIQGGVGGVSVQVPTNAALRIEITGGLGGSSLPSHLKRVKGGDDFITRSGVWETEGYALASQQIYIKFVGGVGGFKLS